MPHQAESRPPPPPRGNTSRRLRDALGYRRDRALDLGADVLTGVRCLHRYRDQTAALARSSAGSNGGLAVVVHLYYASMWPAVREALDRLPRDSYVLVVSIPESSPASRTTVLADRPDAQVVLMPNRGRDVLPFLSVAPVLARRGFTSVLKLHTKKSPHYSAGAQWQEELFEELVPASSSALDQVVTTLASQRTGVIGPSQHFYRLPVNYAQNRRHLQRLLRSAYSPAAAQMIDARTDDFGFFAGTMLWARLDALAPLLGLRRVALESEREKGQTDGTFAHAVERALSVGPSLAGRQLHAISKEGVRPVAASHGTVPAWSGLDSAS